MEPLFAFGQPVPEEVIEMLLEEGMKEEEITTEYIETLWEYEVRDNS